MSTKSAITLDAKSGWSLQEEMLDETTHLVILHQAPINLALHTTQHGSDLRLELPPTLLDTITRIHAERGIPHQRQKETPPTAP